jgi:hypothetical protein
VEKKWRVAQVFSEFARGDLSPSGFLWPAQWHGGKFR